jgi:SAM-dependent methyltransferase
MTTHAVDEADVQAFGGHLLTVLNNASLALMTSIGHQTGLFDTMAGLPPATSGQIAAAAGLNERYVREWLGAMTTGRIVTYDPHDRTYLLPATHAASLTRAAGPQNLAVLMQTIPMVAIVEAEIVECFRTGGGVPYAAFPTMQRRTAELTGAIFDATLVRTTLPLVPGLTDRLQAGIDVADVGCGCGHAINVMAAAFANSRFTGYDFSVEGIATARAEAERLGLANARFLVQDVAALDVSRQYDLITVFDAIHDQAQPARVLRAIAAALRSGGTFLMVDVAASSDIGENLDHPIGPFGYTVSCMHCMTVSLAQNGEGLGAMWGEQKARQMLAEAGFRQVEVKQVPGDVINNYYIARAP